ncbi:hypothetical protein GUJ93_ZPchr0014g47628 [Zizania palustris]|uniref:Uncharacterized protein n=1 Tax=Zizania palustris TaxID=103762 RepID=A0A8J5W0J7_ZIZPA|nr:hypothetical protein GUJ93_ZPchr0014g47628 [Zizania palustris]
MARSISSQGLELAEHGKLVGLEQSCHVLLHEPPCISSSLLNCLSPWIMNRDSFLVSFLLLHNGPHGRPLWNTCRPRLRAMAGSSRALGGDHSSTGGVGERQDIGAEEEEAGDESLRGRRHGAKPSFPFGLVGFRGETI